MIGNVIDIHGEKKSEVTLADNIFAVPIKQHHLYDVVRYQLAKRRQGTSSTKNRSAVRGGGIKPWRQKGTGRARSGSTRSPVWVGGGIIFGPHPRDYSMKINKKVRKSALKSALSFKAQNNDLLLLDEINVEEGKTRFAAKILTDLGFTKGTKVLIVVDGGYENLKLATRNIPDVKVIDLTGLNVYDVLWHQKVILVTTILTKLEESLGS